MDTPFFFQINELDKNKIQQLGLQKKNTNFAKNATFVTSQAKKLFQFFRITEYTRALQHTLLGGSS